jgi:BTB/POZ domain
VFTSHFAEGVPALKGETCENTNKKRVIPMEMEFDTLHTILYYLYTDQIVFHSKSGNETVGHLMTVDVHRLYQAADQLLLPHLKDKAFEFLWHTRDIQNITARVFGEYAKTHDNLYRIYRHFFCTHLPAIVQTTEFDDFFDQLEGTDAERVNVHFRELVQTSLSRRKLVLRPQSTTNTCTGGEEENDDDDPDDLDYVPSDDGEGGYDEVDSEDLEDTEAEEDDDSTDWIEASDEEE